MQKKEHVFKAATLPSTHIVLLPRSSYEMRGWRPAKYGGFNKEPARGWLPHVLSTSGAACNSRNCTAPPPLCFRAAHTRSSRSVFDPASLTVHYVGHAACRRNAEPNLFVYAGDSCLLLWFARPPVAPSLSFRIWALDGTLNSEIRTSHSKY